MTYSRVFLIVLDGLGVGGAPDVADYGDTGSDTLGNLARRQALEIPVLASLGLGNLYQEPLPNVAHSTAPRAKHGRLTELSAGKDTTTGHWEMMGIVRHDQAMTFPGGFPAEIIEEFSARTGRGVIGNRVASGTVIIQELGPQHIETGSYIVYTSADSVFQVAAHHDVVPLEELYAACRIARELFSGDAIVDRVIARPFTGSIETGFSRTVDRKDFSLRPPKPTALDAMSGGGYEVISIGKISDIFATQGITKSFHDHGNADLMARLDVLAHQPDWRGLAFCNLVDFDMLFGHRNNPAGYASALAEFDKWLGGFIERLGPESLCIITADHGNDPTTDSTDHSREQVPVLLLDPQTMSGLGKLIEPPPGFFHIGSTICSVFGLDYDSTGVNLLEL